MSFLADARRFRRLLAGIGLTLGPALYVIVEVIHPAKDSDAAQTYATVSANSDQWYLAHALALATVALTVPALLGLMHMLKASRPAWGHAGVALAFLGLVPLTAVIGTEFALWQATGGEPAAMIAYVDRLMESTGMLVLYTATLLFPIGWVVLALGLYLARAFPAWIPALLGIGIVAAFLGDATFTKWLSVAGAITFFLGAAPIGWKLLTQTDEEWEGGAAPTSLETAGAV